VAFNIGDTIGDYRVLDLLGSGGMGSVYRVCNLITDREEAMKVLLPNLHSTSGLAERFSREIKIQASLEHPHIASLRTAIRVDNQLVMIMEFVEGITLDLRLRQSSIHIAQAVEWIRQVLSALAYAHGRGVIHRDIKPANIMLTRRGTVKLTDFGIASMADDNGLTRTGTAMGSLHYMSPEQIKAKHADCRSDIYSLGVTCYQMLCGRRPFEGASDYEVMKAHLQHEAPPLLSLNPSLPHSLVSVVSRAIAKNPADRFQTAQEFARALELASPVIGAASDATLNIPLSSASPTPLPFELAEASKAQTPRTGALDPTRIDRVRQELAQYIGPVARVLVDRTVKKVVTLQQLYDILAQEIPRPEDRQRFLERRPR
jgi:serine/threonine-protein kinase